MSRLTIRYNNGNIGVKSPLRYYNYQDIKEVLEKLSHYEDLEEQLEKLYGGRLSLDNVIDNLNRIVQNGEEKLDFARILTNAEAEKWDKWKDLEEQGELVVQKHGQWEPVKISGTITIFRCSICRREVHSSNDYFGEPTKHIVSRYPYCHCGAKMEE